MKLDRRGETDWMKDSTPNFHPRNEAKILLAGVAFERLVGEAIGMHTCGARAISKRHLKL